MRALPGAPDARDVLTVTEGAEFCEIDSDGCATTGADGYGNREFCRVRVSHAGRLTATSFGTESCCDNVPNYKTDSVTIDGTSYSGNRGTSGPRQHAVAAGSTFTWTSDATRVEGSGWVICWEPEPVGSEDECRAVCGADPACMAAEWNPEYTRILPGRFGPGLSSAQAPPACRVYHGLREMTGMLSTCLVCEMCTLVSARKRAGSALLFAGDLAANPELRSCYVHVISCIRPTDDSDFDDF